MGARHRLGLFRCIQEHHLVGLADRLDEVGGEPEEEVAHHCGDDRRCVEAQLHAHTICCLWLLPFCISRVAGNSLLCT